MNREIKKSITFMKTKHLLNGIITLFIFTSFYSCKRGDDDPFLSFNSRKARVTGEWIIENWKEESSYTTSYSYDGIQSTNSGNSKYEINGNNITISETNTYSTGISTYNYNGGVSAKISFKKDGTFSRIIEFKNVSATIVYEGNSSTGIINGTSETSGTWNFLGGVEKDYKDKERVILNILKENASFNTSYSDGNSIDNNTQSYANGQYSEVWHLSTLKNKEMVLEGAINRSGSSNSTENSGGSVFTYSNNSTTTGTIKGILKQ
jgi:hypothetical protein